MLTTTNKLLYNNPYRSEVTGLQCCCNYQDLTNDYKYTWEDLECSTLNDGKGIYMTIVRSTKEETKKYLNIPYPITPQELVNITGMSIELAITMLKDREVSDTSKCPITYCSGIQTITVTKTCITC